MSHQRSYTCAAQLCVTTDRAKEMFNLSCNVKRINRAALLDLVRCKECAEKIAASNGRRLHEPGCGVHPLGITLRALQTEDDPIPTGATTYACTSCSNSHIPEFMYNREIGRVPKSIEAVVPHVLCRTCAETHAGQYGLNPCDPGSGIYRLSYTIERMEAKANERAAAAGRGNT